MSEIETQSISRMTAIPLGKQAVSIFNVLLEERIYAGLH